MEKKCHYCHEIFTTNKEHQIYCHDECRNQAKYDKRKKRSYRRIQLKKVRNEVLAVWNTECQNCGENDPDVLSIDHIINIGKGRKPTYSLYYEIIHNTSRAKKKYQLLCRNCNWKKMITNNEHKTKDLKFAYKWELEVLDNKLDKFMDMIKQINSERIDKSKILRKRNINKEKGNDSTYRERVEKNLKHATKLKDENGKWSVTKTMYFHNISDPYARKIIKACELERDTLKTLAKI